jgi:AAA domain
VVKAVAADTTIYIVEGEKSADALAEIGVCGTCSPHGAGKWRDGFSAFFHGADVVILPDNDVAGELHGQAVAKSLSAVAARVRVLRLAGVSDGGDVFDWLKAGGDADQLAHAAEIADERKSDEPKAEQTGWQSHAFTAAALRTMAFPPVSYVVPGIIPEGLTILAGRPKIGKSWMALDLAIGIATGKPVLGGVHVEQGDVLNCCLEDNPRRLQRRVTKLLSPFTAEWPERLTLATRWRRLDDGGVEDIEAWCDSVPNPRLVLLDTLAGVRPSRSGTDTLYEGDYKALRDIHRFANDRGMGAVALHHTRKMDADDPVDTISGSLGLAGAADTCLVLARSSKGTTLYVRGRDIEEGERAVIFGTENCKWTLLGDAAEVYRSDSRSKILEALAGATELMGPAEIATATDIQRNNVDQLLHRMRTAGEVIQVSRGLYAHPSKDFATHPKKPKN